MAGRELVQVVPEDRQVRSYHRAFNVELTIYTIGNNTRLWWPIPVRGVFWAGGIEILMLILTHVAGIHPTLFSPDWGFLYCIVPGGFAWLFAGAKPEGRRLHITLWYWLTRAITGRQTVGGWQRLQHTKRLHPAKIKVRETYAPRKPLHWEKPVAAGLSVLLLVFFAFHFLVQSDSKVAPATAAVPSPARHYVARTAQQSRPTSLMTWGVAPLPILPVWSTLPPTVAQHKSHPITKKPSRISVVNRRHVVAVALHHTTSRRKTSPTNPRIITPSVHMPPIYNPPVHRATLVVRPSVQRTFSAPNIQPHIQSAPCYPGQLGC